MNGKHIVENARHEKLSLRSIASFLPVSFNSFGRGIEAVLRKLSLMEAKVSAVDKSNPGSSQSFVLKRLDALERKLAIVDKREQRAFDSMLPVLDQLHARVSFMLDERMSDISATGRFVALGRDLLRNVHDMLRLPVDKTVSVVFITDDDYVEATRTAVCSLFRNRAPHTKYSVTIIGVDLSEESRVSFSLFGEAVRLLEPRNEYQALVPEHGHVSKAALLKFDIPSLFPALDKVLYLDSDILVNGDLSPLWETDLSGKFAAVVKDYFACSTARFDEKLGLASYFNSGVMLLNTDLLRKAKMPQKLLDAKLNDPVPKAFMDQNAFNMAFGGNVLYVSPTFNLMYSNNRRSSPSGLLPHEFYELPEKEFSAIEENPCILHLANRLKPWSSRKASFYEKWMYENNILLSAEAQANGKSDNMTVHV